MREIIKKEWSELQPIWNELIDNNPISTPFQTYEYLTLTGKGKPQRKDLFRTIGLHELNLVLYVDHVPIAIAPMLYKTKKGKTTVYFRGNFSVADQLDLIYASLSYDDFKYLMDGIRNILGNVSFFLDRVYCETPTSEYLKKYLSSAEIHEIEGFAIPIPECYDDWYQGLRKSRREKIRQSKNRMKTDNVQCTTALYVGEEIDSTLQKDLLLVYADRFLVKNNFHFRAFHKFVKKALQLYLLKDKMTKWLNNADNNIHVIVYMNNEIAAFANGLICKDKRLIGSRLAINTKFKRYSPGAVLISAFVNYLTEEKNAGRIDVEKIDMGGGGGGMTYKAAFGGEAYHYYFFTE